MSGGGGMEVQWKLWQVRFCRRGGMPKVVPVPNLTTEHVLGSNLVCVICGCVFLPLLFLFASLLG